MIRGLEGVLQRIQELEQILAGPAAPAAGSEPAAEPFARVLARAAEAQAPSATPGAAGYDSLIRQAAARYGVDDRLIHAVIRAESDYDPRCVSRAGAKGLMQLMPENCEDYGVSDPFDPAQNIDGGVRQLRDLMSSFGRLDLALAAYNAGAGAVRRYGGIPPYRETQQYVSKILGWLGQ
jgi:soluble lytic murein transglycosylase-like protein